VLLQLLILTAQAAPPPSSSPNIVLIIAGVLAAIFGSAGFWGYLQARRENKRLSAEAKKLGAEEININVEAAQGAVIVQSSVIKDLREQMLAVTTESAKLRVELIAAQKKLESFERFEVRLDKMQVLVGELVRSLEGNDLLTAHAKVIAHGLEELQDDLRQVT
jgi:hypothetical protein